MLTQLIHLAAEGDSQAKESLYSQILLNLRQAAHHTLKRFHNHEFQTTALVNEVVVRFEQSESLQNINNRRVFFSIAIRAMNNIMIDHYRRRKRLIDSPDRVGSPLDDIFTQLETCFGIQFEDLQLELIRLEVESPRQHAVIMHRFFGGLTIKETAQLLDISVQSVERDWRLARAKLLSRLQDDNDA